MGLREDFLVRFPEISEDIVDKWLPVFENSYKAYYNAEYGVNEKDNEIILNLLAHLITVSNNNSTGENVAPVSSKSVGGVNVSYAVNVGDNSDAFFSSTIYGQTFKLLTSIINGGGYFV